MDRHWNDIEQAARAQIVAELAEADTAPLAYGHVVAWVECRYGRTDGLGPVHRVGAWDMERASTICGEVIPAAIRRLPLSASVVRTLGRCRYCEAEYAQQAVQHTPSHGVAA